MPNNQKPGILLVANWDSNVGYAWWLMESFWRVIAKEHQGQYHSWLAYPTISKIPKVIATAPIHCQKIDFTKSNIYSVIGQLGFLLRRRIKVIYYSDQPTHSWKYLLFRLCGVKVIIVHDHTPGLRTIPTGLKKQLKLIINRFPWINADACFGASDFVRDRLISVNCIPSHKCYSIPNGLPPLESEVEAENLEERFGIPKASTVIVSTGRANAYKGVDFAIECMHQLVHVEGVRNIHFLFCGDGPDRYFFHQLVKEKNLQQYVSLPGRVDNIPAILKACDIAIHPSKGEVGYSLSILEYMQAGLPVLVPDNRSVCGSVDHEETGLIYQQSNLASLTLKVHQLIKDKNKSKDMGKKAQHAIAVKFSLLSTHQKLLNSFKQTID